MGFFRESTIVNFMNLIPSIQRLSNPNINKQFKTPTIADVMNAYADIMDKKMFQDALILHLIYSVGIKLDTPVLITYDSLNDSGKLKYSDTLKLKNFEITLNENLIRDILHSKEIMREIKSDAKHEFRCFKDKVVVIGDFSFEYTS